ncbi:LysR family transcriptional regulator [Ponticoccus sp. SC2-23]|uniref:LysR family transcriptional regulator n=1 Tax=Alexandriicola marinus TaxID=2081710 RepID=UPI000FDC95EB|nr:LysR family transcriptional regulator [Alexandriicola marinus]MBM1220606.1 LysR family transcriptional regulator [Ponticoccus sp. SC6-9]MBM1225292.1 LysR family transcriptional regulator [Ponticoccus sp. SC6-15]MBM1228806.1 LysR family transcriptional regulator [Ponticoccus sp. SC6-38]MBM1233557.1 LysR family transcriptional regulator [Ponticoccus sp. SC6-45]MBM1239307.1 LysR family transcriptional regulator [Ponticoccus sp. SC6-49]MBM1243089.1 LysR family transcriptional regulator [Pontic
MEKTPNWSLFEAFLAVAEGGSLSEAARVLGTSQPTLGRHIAALEQDLGLELFQRHPKGLSLTEEGLTILPRARQMREAVNGIALAAAGREADLSGTVRVTASEMLSFFHLPAMIARIRTAHPEIQIELVPSDLTSNLLFREADIAIRMYRPTQLDLVTRHLGDLPIRMFAARRYIDERGTPRSADDLRRHDIVGYDANEAIISGMRMAGLPAERGWFGVRCDNNLANWALVRAGCGIGFGQAVVGLSDPELVEIDIGLPLPPLEVWLTAHEAMRRSARVRRVWDRLADDLGALCRSAET